MSEPEPAPSAFKRWLPDVVLLLVLFALAAKMNYHVWTVRDIGMDDETLYLAHGHYLAEWGLPLPCYSPAYVFWYNAWDRLHLDRIFVYYTNWVLLLYLLAAGQYLLVRALGGFRIGALAVAFLTLTSGVAEVWPYPMHLATFLLAAGTALASRMRSWPSTLFVIGTTLLIGGFLRPEFTTSFMLFCVAAFGYMLWALWKRPEQRRRLVVLSLMLAGLAAALFGTLGNPLSGGRSFFAFGQHYSLNLWATHRTDVDPWTNWESLTHADFGDADSVGQAIRNNPRAFLWHVSCNVGYLPGRLLEVTQVQLGLAKDATTAFRILLFLLATGGGVGLLMRLFRRSTAAADPERRPLRVALLMFLLTAGPTVMAVLVVFPRLHYLIPLTAFTTALAFSGYCGFRPVVERLRWLDSRAALSVFVVILAVVTPNRAHPWSPQQALRKAPAAPAPSLDVQRTVAVLRDLHVHSPQRIGVLEADFSRAFYAGWDFYKVDHWTKTTNFWQFIDEHNISTVVLDERLLTDSRFKDDPEFVAFAAEKSARNFHFFTVPDTKVRVAVREDLLPESQPHAAARP
jgi:hypothetical protein